MKLELGKEYLNRQGDTCVVLDLDYNGKVLVKHLRLGRSVVETHTTDGDLFSFFDNYGPNGVFGKCQYDIIKEKPQELTLVQYVVLYTAKDKPKHLLCWGIYSDPLYLAVAKSNIISSGYNFYGTQKVTLRSDGTKENINF
jgi:hypothetical protein